MVLYQTPWKEIFSTRQFRHHVKQRSRVHVLIQRRYTGVMIGDRETRITVLRRQFVFGYFPLRVFVHFYYFSRQNGERIF